MATSRFFVVFENIGFFVRDKAVKSRAFARPMSNRAAQNAGRVIYGDDKCIYYVIVLMCGKQLLLSKCVP